MLRFFLVPRPPAFLPLLVLGALSLVLTQSKVARAQQVDRVATAAEEDNPFDIHVSIDYGFRYHGLALRREWALDGNRRIARDLLYRQLRHELSAGLEIGIYRGLFAYARLPVVLSDHRDYRFDQSSPDGCILPSQGTPTSPPTCVDKTNSSTLRDGIVPVSGFSASRPSSPFQAYPDPKEATIFRGPNRRGLDQLHLGLGYAILRQDKISAFPTLKLGFEARLGIGAEQKMIKVAGQAPAANRFVGRKIHEFGFWATVHRRYRFVQPFAVGYMRWAVAAKNSALGRISGPGTPHPGPSSTAGASVGALVVPWVQPDKKLRFAIEVAGRLDLTRRGHAYSAAWELLADSPALVGADNPASGACNVGAALQFASLNPSDPSDYLRAANAAPNSGQCVAFSGISRVSAHAALGGAINFRVQLGPFAEVSAGTVITGTSQHHLTGESLGVPTRFGNPDLVEFGTADQNAQRRDVVDRPGRRYVADDILTARVNAQLLLTF